MSEQGQSFQRIILDAQKEMQETRRYYWQARAVGAPTENVVEHMQAALMSYYDALRRYRMKPNVKGDWEEHGFDRIEQVALSDKVVLQKPPGRGKTAQKRRTPQKIDAQNIIEMSYRLDDLSTELGFAAETKNNTPVYGFEEVGPDE